MKINDLKSTSRLFIVLMFFTFTLAALADEEADHAALRLIKAAYEEAVNSGSPAKLVPYLGRQVTGVMVTGDTVAGAGDLEAYWKKIQGLIGPGGSYHVSVNVDKTDLLGDVAVSHGATDDVVKLAGGRELKFNSYWTSVCERQNGEWKVIRMQATMNPVQNVFISALLQKARLAYGAGGFLAGALVVFMAGRLRRPRS